MPGLETFELCPQHSKSNFPGFFSGKKKKEKKKEQEQREAANGEANGMVFLFPFPFKKANGFLLKFRL
jgi:hypothetical protein